MSVLLALAAAVSYGLADFAGGFGAKRAGAWPVAFTALVTGCVLLLALGLMTPGSPTPADYGWASAAGLGNGLGTAYLYRGLARGRMGVVAPVSGVGAAVVPVLTGLALGERPGAVAVAGIAVALPAIWLVAREPRLEGEPASGSGGLGDGLMAGLGFGFLFVALSRIGEDAGLLPLALNQAVAIVAVMAVATGVRASWVPREPAAALGLVSGVLGALATIGFLVASHGGYLSITAVLTSLYPAFTVLLAATVLRERVHASQGVGLALCAVAVALVASA